MLMHAFSPQCQVQLHDSLEYMNLLHMTNLLLLLLLLEQISLQPSRFDLVLLKTSV
jgi:hypothetical protein